jgi:DNA-binding NarL/FixJ family response regulator
MTIRVFLLDDHGIVRRGLRELLEATDDIESSGVRFGEKRRHGAYRRCDRT